MGWDKQWEKRNLTVALLDARIKKRPRISAAFRFLSEGRSLVASLLGMGDGGYGSLAAGT
jgi:hypothetical protein